MAPRPTRSGLILIALFTLTQLSSNASAPGITQVTQTFAINHLVSTGSPIMGVANVSGLFVVTRQEGQCAAQSLRLFADFPDQVLTIGGAPTPPNGYELARTEPTVWNGSSCMTNPAQSSSTLDLTIGGSSAVGATVMPGGNKRLVVAMLRSEGGCTSTNQLGGPDCTINPGAIDFNGDGDLFDQVIAYRTLDFDPSTKNVAVGSLITTNVQADGLSLATDGTTIASFLTENAVTAMCDGGPADPGHMHCPGPPVGTHGTDLDGDGYVGQSRALRLISVDGPSPTTPVIVYTGLSQTEPMTSCPRASKVNDFVAGLPTQRVFIGGGIVAFESDEEAPAADASMGSPFPCSAPAKPGVDYGFNTDPAAPDYADRVTRWFSVADPHTVHVGPLMADRPGSANAPQSGLGLVGTDGTSIAYLVHETFSAMPEMPPNCTDLTHDCDANDDALQIYTIGTGAVTSTGAAASDAPMLGAGAAMLGGGYVAFVTTENAEAVMGGAMPQSINADSDTTDTMLRLYDIAGHRVITTDVTIVDANNAGTPLVVKYAVGTDGVTAAFVATSAGSNAPDDLRYIKLAEGVTVGTGGGGMFSLTADVNGPGSISFMPGGTTCPATCTVSYAANTPVMLTATPSAGAQFSNWQACPGTVLGNTCMVPVTTNVTGIVAVFTATPPPPMCSLLPATVSAALSSSGNRLSALQQSDGGWQWRPGIGGSAVNTFGVTALGLLASYAHTGNVVFLNDAIQTGDTLVARFNAQNPKQRAYTSDVEFLVALAKATGNTTYSDTAAAWFAVTVSQFPVPASRVDVIFAGRDAQGYRSMAAWDAASLVRAAKAVGNVDYAIGAANRIVQREFTIVENGATLPGWKDTDPAHVWAGGQTGNVYSYDHTLLGEGALLSAVHDLPGFAAKRDEYRAFLISQQGSDGSWDIGDAQITSYVAMGLGTLDDAGSRLAIANAACLLTAHQTANGGWASYFDPGGDGPEYTEIDSEVMQALNVMFSTPMGSNVGAQPSPFVSVNFGNATTAGTTTVVAIDPASVGGVPPNFTLTNFAYDISTTAAVTPPITVCFWTPTIADAAFASLRVLHNEGGTFFDRTILPPNTLAPNLATKTICASVNSLSPFVLATFQPPPPPAGFAPTLWTQPSVPIGGFNAIVGAPARLAVSGSDPTAEDVVTLSATSLPEGASFTPSAPGNPVNGTFLWTPSFTQVGTHTFNLVATDGGGMQSQLAVTINVALPPAAPPFSGATLPPTGACLCLPIFGIQDSEAINRVENWYVLADASGVINLTLIARGGNPLETGSVAATIFDAANNVVAVVPPVPHPPTGEASATLTQAVTPGQIYRLQIELGPPTVIGAPQAGHYRFDLRGAVEAGAYGSQVRHFEGGPATWSFNVGANEPLTIQLNPAMLGGPGGPTAIVPTLRLVDANGIERLATTVTLPYTIDIPAAGAVPGQWRLQIDANGHHDIEKLSGADRGIYLTWLTSGSGQFNLSVTRNGTPTFTQGIALQFTNNTTGQVYSSAPFVFSGYSQSLPVGSYTVTAQSGTGVVSPPSVNVDLACQAVVPLMFDVPNHAPTVSIPGSPFAMEVNGPPINLFANWSDPDGDPVMLQWSLLSGGGVLTPFGWSASYANNSGPTTAVVQVIATDSSNASATATATITVNNPPKRWGATYDVFYGGVSSDGDQFIDQPYLFNYGWLFNIYNASMTPLTNAKITATWNNNIAGITAAMNPPDPNITLIETPFSAMWSTNQLASQGLPGGWMQRSLSTNQWIPNPYALGYEVSRQMPEGRQVDGGAIDVPRTFAMTFTTHDDTLSHLAVSVNFTGGPNPGPVSISDLSCSGPGFLRVDPGGVFWKIGEAPDPPPVLNHAYTLNCTYTVTNRSPSPAMFAPSILVTGRRLAAPVTGIGSMSYTAPGVGANPSDPLGTVTFETDAPDAEASLAVGFNRVVILNGANAVIITPPTLTASPLTVVAGSIDATISGIAAPYANVLLFDGANVVGNIPADGSGNWSTQRYFIVGSHQLTATQSSGSQTSGPSTPIVTLHVLPPTPNINSPSSVISATSPATFTLTGWGFYGGGQNPPTGSTVTVFEGATIVGTGVVGSNGQWSASLTLAYGQHSLTASQTLAGETSAMSSPPFVVNVAAPLAPPTLTASPLTIVAGTTNATISGTAVPYANVLLFDGANPAGNIPADGSGNWSTQAYFLVGSHTWTATQSSGGQTSGPSSPPVTVHVLPPTPNINSPSSVISATSPATFTLTGWGFYGGGQTPATGSTVTIFEGATPIISTVVGQNGQWSTPLTLPYGAHSLTASQTLAGETSAMSSPFMVTVSAPLGPPTLTASPLTVVAGSIDATISGIAAPYANVLLFDGANAVGNIPADGSGNWSTQRYFIVGSHQLTATQSGGSQTSGPSTPIVTLHVLPPTPNINSPSSVISATSPATFTLTGWGFYGGGQTPPTGSTVTIFEGATPIGSTVVGQNGQWSTPLTLPYGAHSLTASQTLAGETSALSSSFVVTVFGPPTLTASPIINDTDGFFSIGGTGVPGAHVSLFDGQIQFAGSTVAGNGTWSTTPSSLYLLVGAHTLRATQTFGGQTSGASSTVTVHHVPQPPIISGPSSVVAVTSPATVTLTGWGFYGGGQNPPTGATVSIFEGATVVGSAVVVPNGSWSTSVTLAYGAHSLTASQTLAGETSAMSSPPFVVNVAAPLAPPTLTASPLISSTGNVTVSGDGLPGASVSLFDGSMPFASGIVVNGNGHWSIQRYFLVGSHVLTATQSSGGQTSGPSPTVTVRHVPPTPTINSPSLVVSATSPATFTLTGAGFYGGGQNPPTGSTVTIFEGATPIGTAVVGSNGQWSTPLTLAFGQHSLAASQTLAGETSAMSSPPFVVTVVDTAPVVYFAPPPAIVTPVIDEGHNLSELAIGAGGGGGFVDPGTNETWTVSVNYGDGSPAQALTLLPGPPPQGVAGLFAFNHVYAPGTYILVVTVTDSMGGVGTGSMTVKVNDKTPPVLSLPATMTAEATSASGAAVSFTATANDAVSGSLPVTCSRTSGAMFPMGTTTVNCSATDAAGNTATGAFAVTVTDTTPPTIDAHGNLTADATSASGAVVTYTSPATHDLVDGAGVASCLPASGSTFAPGTTTVTCSATDAHGNTTTSTFTVMVRAITTTTLASSPNPSRAGQSVTFTATVHTAGGTPTGTVTFTEGDTTLATAPVNGSGQAVFSTSTLALGEHAITATYGRSGNFLGSTSASLVQIVFAYPGISGGGFVIGDLNAVVGAHVTFWGAQWEKLNALSGGLATSSFKGFVGSTSTNPPIAGAAWSTGPGNSSGPPAAIPTYMAVMVSSTITKSRSTITGNTTMLAIVRTDPGYSSDPGHAGTGTVIAVIR